MKAWKKRTNAVGERLREKNVNENLGLALSEEGGGEQRRLRTDKGRGKNSTLTYDEK